MTVQALFFFLLIVSLIGCESNLSVMGFQQSEARLSGTEVYAINRMNASAGELINVAGSNLTKGMLVRVGSHLVPLNVHENGLGSFIMPELESKESPIITFLDKDKQMLQSFAIRSGESSSKIPVMDVDPGLVCGDITYADPMGLLHTGTRNCSSSLKLCSSESEMSCITSSAFPPINLDKLKSDASAIRTGVAIAGIRGELSTCGADGSTDCVVVGPTFAAGLTVGLAPKILAGNSVAGISGTASAESHVPCSTNTQMGCVTTSTYQAADLSNLSPTNIKSGVSVAGTMGVFGPNCSSDGGINCLTTNIFRAADTNAYTSFDLRYGRTIGGVPGGLVFSKNATALSTFNRNSGDASSASITDADIYDSIDDYNANGSFPTILPSSWTPLPSNWVRDSLSDLDHNGLCNGSEVCVYNDRLTGNSWTFFQTKTDWESAITLCSTTSNMLTLGGYSSGWRLPTQKEMLQAYINGIWALKVPLGIGGASYYWSASTVSISVGSAWAVGFAFASHSFFNKTDASGAYPVCVR